MRIRIATVVVIFIESMWVIMFMWFCRNVAHGYLLGIAIAIADLLSVYICVFTQCSLTTVII
jgi:hypothetical protein